MDLYPSSFPGNHLSPCFPTSNINICKQMLALIQTDKSFPESTFWKIQTVLAQLTVHRFHLGESILSQNGSHLLSQTFQHKIISTYAAASTVEVCFCVILPDSQPIKPISFMR